MLIANLPELGTLNRQEIAALAGLAFLITSGKLARHNDDWIANHVFVAGGVVIVVVSALAYIGQRRPNSS